MKDTFEQSVYYSGPSPFAVQGEQQQSHDNDIPVDDSFIVALIELVMLCIVVAVVMYILGHPDSPLKKYIDPKSVPEVPIFPSHYSKKRETEMTGIETLLVTLALVSLAFMVVHSNREEISKYFHTVFGVWSPLPQNAKKTNNKKRRVPRFMTKIFNMFKRKKGKTVAQTPARVNSYQESSDSPRSQRVSQTSISEQIDNDTEKTGNKFAQVTKEMFNNFIENRDYLSIRDYFSEITSRDKDISSELTQAESRELNDINTNLMGFYPNIIFTKKFKDALDFKTQLETSIDYVPGSFRSRGDTIKHWGLFVNRVLDVYKMEFIRERKYNTKMDQAIVDIVEYVKYFNNKNMQTNIKIESLRDIGTIINNLDIPNLDEHGIPEIAARIKKAVPKKIEDDE